MSAGCGDTSRSDSDADSDQDGSGDVGSDIDQDIPGDESPPDQDIVVNTDTIDVAFDGGILTLKSDPFSWRIQSDPENRVGSSPRHPDTTVGLAIEYGEEDARDQFNDPRPRFDQPIQRWVARTVEQDDPMGTTVMHLEAFVGPDVAQVTVTFEPVSEGLEIRVEPEGELPVQRIEWLWDDNAKGALYGAGLHYDTMNLRGGSYPTFRDDALFRESGSNDVSLSIPAILNTQGWLMFFQTDAPGMFDLGTEEDGDNLLRARFDADSLRIRLWLQDQPSELFRRYTAIVGVPALPPRWALAPQFVRRTPTTDAELEELATLMRALDVPGGGFWLGPTWQTAWNDFTFNPLLADFQTTSEQLAMLGYKVVMPVTPYLDVSDDSDVGPDFGPATGLFETASNSDYLVSDTEGSPALFEWSAERRGGLVDFTNPEARDWWSALARPAVDQGVGGLLLDRGEDLRAGALGFREELSFSDGSTERVAHARFADGYHESMRAAFEPDEGLVVGRTGTWGSWTSMQGLWTGKFERSFAEPDAESIGGLPAAVRALASAGASGFPFVGSVSGGDFGEPISRDLYLRWMAVSVFSPLMLVGMEPGDEPWSQRFDSNTLSIVKQFLQLRMRLIPYLEQELSRAHQTGLPVVRPLSLYSRPTEPTWDADDQFLFGNDVMVAPIVQPGATSRDVVIPDGPWRSWKTGELIEGPLVKSVNAPIDSIPLFARDTVVIPMQLEFADTMLETDDPGVTDAGDIATTPVARAVGQADGAVSWADGSNADLVWDPDEQSTTVIWRPGENAVGFYVEFHGTFPNQITCDGTTVEQDDSIALVPLETSPSTGYRPLPTGIILRLGEASTCIVSWK